MEQFDDEFKKALDWVSELDSLSLGSSELELNSEHELMYYVLLDYLINEFVSRGIPARTVYAIVGKTLSLAAASWLMPTPFGE